MHTRSALSIIVVVFTVVWLFLLPTRLAEPLSQTFSNDASEYSGAAVYLADVGFYSLDGSTPFIEREPGYSFFLAGIYKIFGNENRIAIFLIQGLLYLAALLFFVQVLRKHANDRVAFLSGLFLVLLSPIYYIVFTPIRESLSLSLLLLFVSVFLLFLQIQTWRRSLLLGVLLGYIILVNYPFIFFPFFLIGLFFFLRLEKKYLLIIIVSSFLIVSLWGARNQFQVGEFRVVGSFRTTAIIYARAEQSESIRGFEPARCLWAEYISRDWSKVSDACSLNSLMHAKWPGSIPTGQDVQIAKESRVKILKNFPHYVWFSLFEILELHFPYANGWGFVYNLLSAIAMLILYVGCIIAFSALRKREYAILTTLILYNTLIYIMTDATPRYLLPVIFCYVVFAAIGYDRLLSRFTRS